MISNLGENRCCISCFLRGERRWGILTGICDSDMNMNGDRNRNFHGHCSVGLSSPFQGCVVAKAFPLLS